MPEKITLVNPATGAKVATTDKGEAARLKGRGYREDRKPARKPVSRPVETPAEAPKTEDAKQASPGDTK